MKEKTDGYCQDTIYKAYQMINDAIDDMDRHACEHGLDMDALCYLETCVKTLAYLSELEHTHHGDKA